MAPSLSILENRHVLLWEDLFTWSHVLETILPEVTDMSVKSALRENPPQYFVSDDLEWLDRVVRTVHGNAFDSGSTLADRLLESFTHIRAYHGCRPVLLSGYSQDGIVPLDVDQARFRAKHIFKRNENPVFTNEIVDESIAAVSAHCRKGRIFFEASRKYLLDHCGHYLLYGSEYILGIAAELTRRINNGIDYALMLRRVGVPTLLTCDVPIRWLSPRTMNALASGMLATYFERAHDPSYSHPRMAEGFGFEIIQALPPTCIVSISHPGYVRDLIRPES